LGLGPLKALIRPCIYISTISLTKLLVMDDIFTVLHCRKVLKFLMYVLCTSYIIQVTCHACEVVKTQVRRDILHWLDVTDCITFRLCVHVFLCLHGAIVCHKQLLIHARFPPFRCRCYVKKLRKKIPFRYNHKQQKDTQRQRQRQGQRCTETATANGNGETATEER